VWATALCRSVGLKLEFFRLGNQFVFATLFRNSRRKHDYYCSAPNYSEQSQHNQMRGRSTHFWSCNDESFKRLRSIYGDGSNSAKYIHAPTATATRLQVVEK
jgi:hypothetical protein